VNYNNIELPSNKKFGFFFTILFMFVGIFFFYVNNSNLSWLSFALSIVLLLITLIKPEALLPLNKVWMLFGVCLGMIVNPIVLGIIFFALFTPIGLMMRLFGRDELKLKLKPKASYWKLRTPSGQDTDNFKRQF